MGQREEVCEVGAGTVRMGRWVVVEMGGEGGLRFGLGVEVADGCGRGGAAVVEGGAERETVFGTVLGGSAVVGLAEVLGRGLEDVGRGSPEIIGGGSSSPSAALRESCRAKSEACHHSRNLRAKMEVGRRILRLERRRGIMRAVMVLGLNMLFAWPGRAPGVGGTGGGFVASSIAL